MRETKKFTVLVVDDEPNNLEVLGQLLSTEYRVLVAANAENGLAIALSQRPDLILLDVVMPNMGGYEICAKLKAEEVTRDIPIIFVTAISDPDYENKGFIVGGVDYVIKPINPITLRARVKTHIELKHKTDLLKSMATLDGLTGIANRRRLDEFLEQEWRRAIRGRSKYLSLIILDIDYFKDYNDYYGHQEGDHCLQQIAAMFQKILERATDLVARYGGEEFCFVMPETSLEGCIYLAKKIQQGINELAIPHAKSKILSIVSVSMGLATIIPSINNSYNDLLMLADQRLYSAKQHGRNRFCYE